MRTCLNLRISTRICWINPIIYIHVIQFKMFQCDRCTKSYNRDPSFRTHKLTYKEKTYSCTECDATFTYKDSLKQHADLHSSTAAFICPQCGKRYKHQANPSRHMMMHMQSYRCDICNRNFHRKKLPDGALRDTSRKRASQLIRNESMLYIV